MYKNWVIGLLVVALAAVSYVAYSGMSTARSLRAELRAAKNQVAKATRPAGTTTAPTQESKAGTQKDPTGAEGCLGCHKKVAPDKDYTVQAELKKIKGHPELPASATIPKACTNCHKAGSSMGEFYKVIHKPHLTGATYTKEFDTNCLGCHSITNGQPGAKGLTT
ncbi:MAG: hypothetical protein ACM3RP_04875 [Chitinophagales bacterium]